MKRSTFIQNLLGFYGVVNNPSNTLTETNKTYLLKCFVRGFQFYDGPTILHTINKKEPLTLVREPQNKYDNQAIAIHFNNTKIGYIPAEDNKILSVLMDAKVLKINAEITHINSKANSWDTIRIAVYTS